ncbi:hypothetical protein FB45DRAFT_31397 [Roridomyces roridus]|uniref:Uncharacterized protein n=1 Tax=Roridomyces roridus TaxID=1738132 RepID=A0AAD7CN63_9AGAR|nr:hypothetical protein FB45DRAFT_31397 [Roridomyces roridus]
MSRQLIPKPRWSNSICTRVKDADLLDAMGWKEKQLEELKKHIRETALKMGIDADKQEKDQVKFQRLASDCARAFPGLKKFEGYWPVEMYLTKWMYWRTTNRTRHERKRCTDKSVVAEKTPMARNDNPPNSKKRKFFADVTDEESDDELFQIPTPASASRGKNVPLAKMSQQVKPSCSFNRHTQTSGTLSSSNPRPNTASSQPLRLGAFPPGKSSGRFKPAGGSDQRNQPSALPATQPSSTSRTKAVAMESSSQKTSPSKPQIQISAALSSKSHAGISASPPSRSTTFQHKEISAATSSPQTNLSKPVSSIQWPPTSSSQLLSKGSTSQASTSRRDNSTAEPSHLAARTGSPASPSASASQRTQIPTPSSSQTLPDSSAPRQSRPAGDCASAAVSSSNKPSAPPGPSFSPSSPDTPATWGCCVFCGVKPNVPDSAIVELTACFKGQDVDLLGALRNIGVVSDCYFRILLRLTRRERSNFLSKLVFDYMNPMEKMEIIDLLENYEDRVKARAGSRPSKKAKRIICRPDKAEEEYIARHKGPHVYLKKHMQIDDDGEYFEIMKLVETKAKEYLDLSIPFEEQEANIKYVTELLCEERPSFLEYEDVWPIRVHLRRFFSQPSDANATQTQSSSQRLRPPASTQCASPPHHECSRLQKYPPQKVPPCIVAFLTDYGMQELGPVCLFLGVKNFDALATSAGRKRDFLEQLGRAPLGWSVFQRMMMEHILEAL